MVVRDVLRVACAAAIIALFLPCESRAQAAIVKPINALGSEG